MRRSFGLVLAVLVTVGSVVAVALAASPKVVIRPVAHSDAGASALARSIFVKPSELIVAKFVGVPPDGSPAAIGYQKTSRSAAFTGRLAAFPRAGDSFAILSTGCATLAVSPNTSGSSGCRDGGLRIRGARDLTMLRIKLHVPAQANCLSFRFRFLSEEFPEFVGSAFNDAFIAELDHSIWTASTSTDPHITAPNSFARDAKGNLISVNAAGVASVTKSRAKGTTYDAATRVLRASTPISPGNHRLYLSIFDQGDRIYDSAVFIDDLTLDRRSPCHSGVLSG